MNAPPQQDIAQGHTMADLREDLITMAPKVGTPCAAVGGENILRRDTGYA